MRRPRTLPGAVLVSRPVSATAAPIGTSYGGAVCLRLGEAQRDRDYRGHEVRGEQGDRDGGDKTSRAAGTSVHGGKMVAGARFDKGLLRVLAQPVRFGH